MPSTHLLSWLCWIWNFCDSLSYKVCVLRSGLMVLKNVWNREKCSFVTHFFRGINRKTCTYLVKVISKLLLQLPFTFVFFLLVFESKPCESISKWSNKELKGSYKKEHLSTEDFVFFLRRFFLFSVEDDAAIIIHGCFLAN